MNILFLLDNDKVFHPIFCDNLLSSSNLKSHNICIGIVNTQSPFKGFTNLFYDYKKKFIFAGGLSGIMKFAFMIMMRGLLKLIGQYQASLTLRQSCRKHQIRYFVTNNANNLETENIIKDFGPDILFSMQGHILKKNILIIPTKACINKHSGLLPKYRGVWPVFWTLLHQEETCGVTLHLMNEKIDDGEIVNQYLFPILKSDTVYSLYQKIFNKLPELVCQVVEAYSKNQVITKPNPTDNATYFSFPKMIHIRKLKNESKRNII